MWNISRTPNSPFVEHLKPKNWGPEFVETPFICLQNRIPLPPRSHMLRLRDYYTVKEYDKTSHKYAFSSFYTLISASSIWIGPSGACILPSYSFWLGFIFLFDFIVFLFFFFVFYFSAIFFSYLTWHCLATFSHVWLTSLPSLLTKAF